MDVVRIARLKRQARKEGKVFTDDDVQVFEQRKYKSVLRLGRKISNGDPSSGERV